MDDTGPITSRENRRLVRLRKIRDGKERGSIFIEGVRLCEEAIRSGLSLDECFISESFDARGLVSGLAVEPVVIADRLFSSVADTDSSQGIILTAARPKNDLASIEERLQDPGGIPLVLYLSEINNPANLGAVIRTAEAAGAAGVITSTGSANAFSPKALRASMGSAFRLPVVEDLDLEKAARWAVEKCLVAIGVDVDGNRRHDAVDWLQPSLVVFGSEAHGLEPEKLAVLNSTVVIGMESAVESLNLAVSAGVILFEARRQNLTDSRSRSL